MSQVCLVFLRFRRSFPFLRSCASLEPINKTERFTEHLEEISRNIEPDSLEDINNQHKLDRFRRVQNSDNGWIQKKEE